MPIPPAIGPGSVVREHVAEQNERGRHVEQGSEWIPQSAVGSRQVWPSDAEDEHAGDGQQVEDVGSEDDVGVKQVVERRRRSASPRRPRSRPATKSLGSRRRNNDQHRAGDRQEDGPDPLREDGVGRGLEPAVDPAKAARKQPVAGHREVSPGAREGIAVERDERRAHDEDRDDDHAAADPASRLQ